MESQDKYSSRLLIPIGCQKGNDGSTDDDGSTNDDPGFRDNSDTFNTLQAVSDTHESRVSPFFSDQGSFIEAGRCSDEHHGQGWTLV